ncbi:inner membrane protein YbjM [Brenneria izbisi]|uniref:Inner membrane protein YbjM n=1 Tax=Brenneria izbisi TaxID=2939450 RepID=A0AA41XYQ3_9GAMM|nr:inner membrane protein YbjM [Brenneria izbisi]MCV9879973.1 inner membrane protein YbjM [Brenneria izbisi]MCV9883362.1 inner membrane protein YbjM [Brenneria izbisi]
MANEKGWVGVACSFLLFIVVFLSQKMAVVDAVTGESLPGGPGMLLFLLPGAIASVLSVRGRLLYPLFGALMAMPICLIILHLWRMPLGTFGQELAYILSAVFWSVLGALGFLFLNGMYRRYIHDKMRER